MARGTTGTTTTGKAKRGGAFALTGILVPLHILIFTALLIMCAIVFHNYNAGGTGASMIAGSPAALMLLIFSLLAGAVGLATMIMAAIHAGSWTESARYSSLAANLVTFALVALAFGFACQVANNKPYHGHGGIGNLLIAIIAFDIFLGLSMLLYLAHLGLFKHNDHNDYDNRSYNTTRDTHPGAIGSTTGGHTHPHTTPGAKEFVGGHEERALHA